MNKLAVEINKDFAEANTIVGPFIITPPINEDYWLFRVKLHEDQSIVGFPKFITIGIGFAQEEDWNTNLPYTQPAQQIFDHIKHNKKYDQIPDEQCIEAINLIQEAIKTISNREHITQ